MEVCVTIKITCSAIGVVDEDEDEGMGAMCLNSGAGISRGLNVGMGGYEG